MHPKYIDIHSHVNFKAFDADREELIESTVAAGTWMMNVGTQKDTSQFAVDLAHKFDTGVYAAIALHPIHTSASHHDEQELGGEGKAFTSRGEIFDPEFYETLGRDPKVLAIGECGLDYYRITDHETRIMEDTFRKHIEVALTLDKPLMLHIRSGSDKSAYKDAAAILKSYFVNHGSRLRGDVHFFAGSWEEARWFLDLGFTLSFTGVITFTHDYDEVVKNIPLDMILSETDCPYVTPVPHRGKRNEPMYVEEVVKKIADIRGEDQEKVRLQILANAKRVFRF